MRVKIILWCCFSLFLGVANEVSAQEEVAVNLLNYKELSVYEKVEFGVQLPQELSTKINRFVQSRIPVSYQSSDTNMLNPFDPEQLDVQVFFWQSNNTEKEKVYKRLGFYYAGFAEGNGTIVTVKTKENIRVRFTPQEIGAWKCKALVIVGKDTLFSPVVDFECVTSKANNTGFLKVSKNKHYFEIGDSSFFPVGQNIPWPGDIWYNGLSTLPHRDYEAYHQLINRFSESGGNYFRMLLTPWTYDFEFENLGNYSNRMGNAWELDRLIQFSEEKGLKIHFNMLLHGAFENPSVYTITNWDWPAHDWPAYKDKACVTAEDKGFCYARELGLSDPVSFFTNKEAKRFYKNKLRYLIARWGYSTSIGVLELVSEINNIGQQGNLQFDGKGCPNIGTLSVPYLDSARSVPKIVLAWQNEMAKYIKQDLQHDNHPLAVSYTSQPDFKNGDLSYYSPFIDIATYNAYSYDRKQNKYARLTSELVAFRKHPMQISNSILRKDDKRRSVALNKPFMLSEIGSGLSDCSQSTVWKQAVFLSPFTGLAGGAMPWLNYNNNRDTWRYFKGVNQFMKTVPLNTNEWESDYRVSNSKKVEALSLHDSKTKLTVGVVNNKTYNYFTMRDACTECFCAKDTVADWLTELQVLSALEKENQLKLGGLGLFTNYLVSWYNPIEGNYLSTNEAVRTNFFGQLKLSYPTLEKEEIPFVYFRLEKK